MYFGRILDVTLNIKICLKQINTLWYFDLIVIEIPVKLMPKLGFYSLIKIRVIVNENNDLLSYFSKLTSISKYKRPEQQN